MAKLFLLYALVGLGLVMTCTATMYIVGDTAGWDISTDLDSWVKDKIFKVGDVLWFQYSSPQSVSEVNRESFNGCNVTNVLGTYTNGNTSVPLPNAGDRYFISGNKLYCLGGMKLHVHVDDDRAASPANAPEASRLVPGAPSSLQRPAVKNNLPTGPASVGFVQGGRHSFVLACLGFLNIFVLI